MVFVTTFSGEKTGQGAQGQITSASTSSRKGAKERKRRWAPKARSGCITCRIRRIKCDEDKPACKRCSSTGRKCDGYDSSPEPMLHQPKLSVAPLKVKPTWDELQMFHYFGTEVARKVAGPFDQAFWTVDVLRAAHIHPSLWHACNALAAMYRRYTLPKAKARVQCAEDRYNNIALAQYNASIRALVKLSSQTNPSPADKSVILATTVLYTGFCSLRGNQKEGFIHTRNGLTLFQQWKIWEQEEESQQILPLASLVTLFNRLDSQALSIMGDASRLTWQSDNLPRKPSNKPFASITEAYFEFEVLLNGYLELMRAIDSVPMTVQKGPIPINQIVYRRAFEIWSTKFATLQSSGAIRDSDKEALLSMQIRQITVEAALNMDIDAEELCWDVFQREFDQILSLSEELLECYYGSSGAGSSGAESSSFTTTSHTPMFSFGVSHCEPLYLIAASCRDRIARRKAIELLRRWPHREGIWDTLLAAAVSEAIMHWEEGGAARSLLEEGGSVTCECLPEGFICHGHRVADVTIDILGEWACKARLRTINDLAQGRPGKVVELSW